jgi:DNA-directed RNA polymerase specialized sigma24 family protein
VASPKLPSPLEIEKTLRAAGPALAPAHAAALRLAAAGASAGDIARALDIPDESVAPLLEIALAKLARLSATRAKPPAEARGRRPGGPMA